MRNIKMNKKQKRRKQLLQRNSSISSKYAANWMALLQREKRVQMLRAGLIPEEETTMYLFGIPDLE